MNKMIKNLLAIIALTLSLGSFILPKNYRIFFRQVPGCADLSANDPHSGGPEKNVRTSNVDIQPGDTGADVKRNIGDPWISLYYPNDAKEKRGEILNTTKFTKEYLEYLETNNLKLLIWK